MASASKNIKFSKIAENDYEVFQDFPQPVLKIRDGGYSGYSYGSGNNPVWGTDNNIDKVTLDGSDGVYFEDVIIETGTTKLREHMVGKNWTWSAWYKWDVLNASDYWMCINTDNDGNTNWSTADRDHQSKDNRLLMSWDGNKLEVHTYSENSSGSMSHSSSVNHKTGTTIVAEDTWYMITSVKTPDNELKVYINGKHELTVPQAPTVKNTDYWSVGQEWDTSPSNHMEGQVKKIMLWDVPLTEEQILHVYHLGRYSRTPYIVEDIVWTTNGGSSNDQNISGSRVLADASNWHGWAASEPYMSTIGFECKRYSTSLTYAMIALQRNGDSISSLTTHASLSYVVYLNSNQNGLYTYYNGGGQGTWWNTYLSPDSGSVGRSPNTDDKIKLMINQETNKVELSINDRIIYRFSQTVSDSDYPFRVVATCHYQGFKECKFIKRNMVSDNTYTERADWSSNYNQTISRDSVLSQTNGWNSWSITDRDPSIIGIQGKRFSPQGSGTHASGGNDPNSYYYIGLLKYGSNMANTDPYKWNGWKLYINDNPDALDKLKPRYNNDEDLVGSQVLPSSVDNIIKLLVNQNTQEVEIYIDDTLVYTFATKVSAGDYPLAGVVACWNYGFKDLEIIKYKRDNEVNLKPIDKNPQAFDPVFDPPYTHHSQYEKHGSWDTQMGDVNNGTAGSIRNSSGFFGVAAGSWEGGRSIVNNGNTTHWYQIDYSADGADKTSVAGVVTYGRSGSAQWVTKWKFQYSSDGSTWEWVDDGYEFDGNTHNDQRNMVYFASPVITTGIRFFAQGYYSHPSARMALLLYKPNAPLYAIVDGHKSFLNVNSVGWENGVWLFNGNNHLRVDGLLSDNVYCNRSLVGKTTISFSCWFYKINQGSEGDVIYSCNQKTTNKYIHKINLDGSLHFYWSTDTVWKTRTGFIEDNKWYHYAFTRQDGTFTFYINGKKISDNDIVLHNNSATKNPLTGQPNYVYIYLEQGGNDHGTRFNIGQEWDSGGASDHWRGMMKNIYFWDRELTEDEVYSVYHNFGISMNNFKRKVLNDYTIVPETSMSINSHFKNKDFLGIPKLYSFSSHTFTNCGATGQNGPTLEDCRTEYASTSWANNTDYFNMTTRGYQIWTVPVSGTYDIYASGSTGGSSSFGDGGNGRSMKAEFYLSRGTKLVIIIGQKGINGSSQPGGGGGGGTFVSIENDPLPLIVAGGGGGAGAYNETTIDPINQDGVGASRENNGTDARPMGPGSWGIAIGSGGTGGNGGTSGESHRPGAGGGGWLTDGTEYTAKLGGGDYGRKGLGYPNGLIGGNSENNGSIYGGFGGGGGGGLGGGGGGGYSGGGGGVWTGFGAADHGHGGGGGGSYIASSGTSANLNQYLGNSHGNCQITLL